LRPFKRKEVEIYAKNKKYEDEFIPFLGKIVKIRSIGHELPLYGKLVALSAQFLTFERRDGRRTLVHRRQILTIEPVRKQNAEDA
jgi:hypothetical protein